jgi:pSer/pThr/pTyr-binding forkhead associated (FHA) protein
VLQQKSVSRKHAAIRQQTGAFILDDLGSTRGTSLNGRRLTEPRQLRDGDMVQIGEVLLAFGNRVAAVVEQVPSTVVDPRSGTEESELAEVLVDPPSVEVEVESCFDDVLVSDQSGQELNADHHAPSSESTASTDQELGKFASSFYDTTTRAESLREECVRIRELLESNHVKRDNAEQQGLIDRILEPDPDVRDTLGAGFYRLVVLDAARGLGPSGLFDDQQFVEAVRAELVHSFGLRLDNTAFHIEDIFQMLKDEQRSLFCFANFQLLPVVHFRTVRGFTQGVHRVLLLTRGSRDIAHEERLYAQGETSDEPAE